MTVYEEYAKALEAYKAMLPEFMKDKHKDAPPEVRDLLSALAGLCLHHLPHVIGQRGAAGVSAMRLAFEIAKVID